MPGSIPFLPPYGEKKLLHKTGIKPRSRASELSFRPLYHLNHIDKLWGLPACCFLFRWFPGLRIRLLLKRTWCIACSGCSESSPSWRAGRGSCPRRRASRSSRCRRSETWKRPSFRRRLMANDSGCQSTCRKNEVKLETVGEFTTGYFSRCHCGK